MPKKPENDTEKTWVVLPIRFDYVKTHNHPEAFSSKKAAIQEAMKLSGYNPGFVYFICEEKGMVKPGPPQLFEKEN